MSLRFADNLFGSDSSPDGVTPPYQTLVKGILETLAGDELQVIDHAVPYTDALTNAFVNTGTSWDPGEYISIKAFPGHAPVLRTTAGSGIFYNIYQDQTRGFIKWDGIGLDGRANGFGTPLKLEGWAGASGPGSGDPHDFWFTNLTFWVGKNGIPNEGTDSGNNGFLFTAIVAGLTGRHKVTNFVVDGTDGGDPGDYSYAGYVSADNCILSNFDIFGTAVFALQVYNFNAAAVGHPPLNTQLVNGRIHDISRTVPGVTGAGIVNAGQDTLIGNVALYRLVGNGIEGYSANCIRMKLRSVTVTGCGGVGVLLDSGSTDADIESSISWGNGRNFQDSSAGGTTTTAFSYDGTNPQFISAATDNFKLLPTSPLLGLGIVDEDLPDDIAGTPRPPDPDPGAYQGTPETNPGPTGDDGGVNAGSPGPAHAPVGAYIPVGSLAFSGSQEREAFVTEVGVPMKFHSPTGADLGAPASAPDVGAVLDDPVRTLHEVCQSLVSLDTGEFMATSLPHGPDVAYDETFAFVGGVRQPTGTTGSYLRRGGLAGDYTSNFYSSLLISSTAKLYLIQYSKLGVQLSATLLSNSLGSGFNQSLGISPDGTTAYFIVTGFFNNVYQVTIASPSPTSIILEGDDPFVGASASDNALLVLRNGDILVAWRCFNAASSNHAGTTRGGSGYIKHYDASGTLLHTYALAGTLPDPFVITAGLTDASFWIGYYDDTLTTERKVRIAEIQVGTGTVLNSFAPDDGAGFAYNGPFCLVRVAIGAPAVASCSGGGEVAVVDNPPDGPPFVGQTLEPRSWVVINMDDRARGFAIDTLPHKPEYDGGRKHGNLITGGTISRQLSGRDSPYKMSTGSWEIDDSDRLLSRLEDSTAFQFWFNREIYARLATAASIRAAQTPHTRGRFLLREYENQGLKASLSGTSVLGSEYSPLNLDKTIPSRQIKEDFPDAPKDSLEAYVPIGLGIFPDPAWIPQGDPVTGVTVTPVPRPPAPTGLTLTLVPGAGVFGDSRDIDLGETLHYAVSAFVAGVESEPVYGVITTTGRGDGVQIEFDPYSGATNISLYVSYRADFLQFSELMVVLPQDATSYLDRTGGSREDYNVLEWASTATIGSSSPNGLVVVTADTVNSPGNGNRIEVVNGSGGNVPLSAASAPGNPLGGSDITVTLATSSLGTPDASKNTAKAVASVIGALSGVQAKESGTGDGVVTPSAQEDFEDGGGWTIGLRMIVDWYVFAQLPDGTFSKAGKSPTIVYTPIRGTHLGLGRRRDVNVSWDTYPDAVEYYAVRHVQFYNGWQARYDLQLIATAPTTAVNDINNDDSAIPGGYADAPGIIVPDAPTGCVIAIPAGKEVVAGKSCNRLVVFGHAIRDIDKIFRSRSSQGTDAPSITDGALFQEIPDSDYGQVWYAPTKPGWPFPNNYVEYNGNWYTVIFTTLDPLPDQVLVNCCAFDDAGDGTGSTIDGAARQLFLLLQQYILPVDGEEYRSGALLAPRTFQDGTPVINSDSVARAERVQAARIGRYYRGQIYLDKPTTVQQILATARDTFGFRFGENQHGQFMMVHLDDFVDLSTCIQLSDIREIVADTSIQRRLSEMENKILFDFGYRPALDGQFLRQNQSLQDDTAIGTKTPPTGNLGRVALGDRRAMLFADDPDTVQDVIYRELQFGKYPPRYCTVTCGLQAVMVQLGRIIVISQDYQGIGARGWTNRPLLVVGIQDVYGDADTPPTIQLTCVDVQRLLSGAGVMADEAAAPTNWSTATDEAKGSLMFMADELTGAFADGSPAKEMR